MSLIRTELNHRSTNEDSDGVTRLRRATSMRSYVKIWSKQKADIAIKAIIETIISRFEPPERIEDTFFLAELNLTAPGLVKLLPTAETVFSKYLPEIDLSCCKQSETYSSRIPGDFTIRCDGVQVGNHNHILFTKSEGPVTQFVDLL